MKLGKRELMVFASNFDAAALCNGLDMDMHITYGRQGWGCIVIVNCEDCNVPFVMGNRPFKTDKNGNVVKRTPSQLIEDILMWYCPLNFADYYRHDIHATMEVSAAMMGTVW